MHALGGATSRRRIVRWLWLPCIVATSALLAGCAPAMTVSAHSQRGLDLQQYRTYDWGPSDALPHGDPRLEENRLVQDHLEGAVERQMAARGYGRAAPGGAHADLLVHYHGCIDARIEEDQTGLCDTVTCERGVAEFERGTLVIDIVDARTGQVVWRGWAQHRIDHLLDNPDRLIRHLETAVARVLEQLPRAAPAH